MGLANKYGWQHPNTGDWYPWPLAVLNHVDGDTDAPQWFLDVIRKFRRPRVDVAPHTREIPDP